MVASQTSKTRALALKAAQLSFFLGICGYLGYRLTAIGWTAIWDALPATPWFYIILLGNYFIQPLTDARIYKAIWHRPVKETLRVFLRKRILNEAVLGYSGEAYLYFWARAHLNGGAKPILAAIKDNNILSAAVSTLTAALLVLIFFVSGKLAAIADFHPSASGYLLGFLGLSALITPIAIRFRRNIFSLPGRLIRRILLLHGARQIAVEALQILQWSVALPAVPFSTWLMFTTAQMVLTRIPLLPNKDLLLLGLGVSLSSMVGVPHASIAGLFLAAAAVTQSLHGVIFLTTALSGRNPATNAVQTAPESAPDDTPSDALR